MSELELELINTWTFQRLKKIKQLGLASYVFPGAEHSRFAHSIGAMFVMSQMIDSLRNCGCEPLGGDDGDQQKQKLRLAALLHDIGHYPLSHLGERAFKWADSQKAIIVTEGGDIEKLSLLAQATENHKSDAASHERIGQLILTHEKSELRKIIQREGFDPEEIARIINGEAKENLFYSQLMSSTLDCDRIDFLLRDSLATGTSYGKVDVAYIIQNIRWDDEKQRVYFNKKAINALEHFVMAHYFMYQIYFHKTIVGLELLAKVLFYCMIRDENLESNDYGPIVKSISDIEARVSNDANFLANFTDEYFWFYLDLWKPEDPFVTRLKDNLLRRVPLRVICEEREFLQPTSEPSYRYSSIAQNLLGDIFDSEKYSIRLRKLGITQDQVCVLPRTAKLEQFAYLTTYQTRQPDPEEELKLIKILGETGAENLIDQTGSILNVLSGSKLCIARVYALLDRGGEEESVLSEVVREYIESHKPQA